VILRAIERYHELLAGPLGPASVAAFRRATAEARLTFGERPICQALRPLFVSGATARTVRSEAETLAGAFRKVLALLSRDRSWRDLLGLTAAEEALLDCDRQPFEPDQIARLDGFLQPDGAWRVIEYNAESPGGIAFGDELARIFRDLPVMQEFAREYELTAYDGLANTLRQLLAAHETRVGASRGEKPVIAVVDWKSAPTRREFEICADYFAARGCPARVVEPDELRFEDGRLSAGGAPIDIVYKRVLVGDLAKHGGAKHPLARAVRAGAVTCVSRFQVHLLFRKELFAFLCDDRLAGEFTEAERAAIGRCIPWSRIVEDVELTFGGERTRLFDLVRRRRERLVLKPTDQYGGKGVVLGWLATPGEWEQTLQAAHAEPHLVQERVALHAERYPVLDGDQIRFASFFADVNPYVWGGERSDGFGARLAPGALLNVTAGGGSAVPVFVLG
jgi:uncharacterized circularly permuted ATP-grasp superfamily protein